MIKGFLYLSSILLICSWQDHPDREYRDSAFDRIERDLDPNHSEGWTPESDNSNDTSESVQESRGTCTGTPDRDR